LGKCRFTSLVLVIVFGPRNEMGSSGWYFPLSASGPRPNSRDSRSEKMAIKVEEIVSGLRTGVYLGESQHVVLLCHEGDSGIGGVVGGTEYPCLAPCEKQGLLIKVNPGNLRHLTSTDIKPSDPTDYHTGPQSSNKSIQSKPITRYMKPRC